MRITTAASAMNTDESSVRCYVQDTIDETLGEMLDQVKGQPCCMRYDSSLCPDLVETPQVSNL